MEAPYTNSLFLDDLLDESSNLYEYVNIISFDGWTADSDLFTALMTINLERIYVFAT